MLTSARCPRMRYFIIARSKAGWGVALESDLLAEFNDLAGAQTHAQAMCETATFLGDDFEVLDLSDADTGSVFMSDEPSARH